MQGVNRAETWIRGAAAPKFKLSIVVDVGLLWVLAVLAGVGSRLFV